MTAQPEKQLSVATTRPHLGHDHAEGDTSLPQSGHFRKLPTAFNLLRVNKELPAQIEFHTKAHALSKL